MPVSQPLRLALLLLIPAMAAVIALLVCTDAAHDPAPPTAGDGRSLESGYRMLRTILKDEQHLKTLRVAKAVVALQDLSEPTKTLVDEIAATSSQALDELNDLAALNPPIVFGESSPTAMGQATLDSIRRSTVKELILTRENYEFTLVVSQSQALHIAGYLARELVQLDPNLQRQTWLADLAARFESLYMEINARLTLSAGQGSSAPARP